LSKRRREKTTFAVVFTPLPTAIVIEKKEKGIVMMDRKTGLARWNGKGLDRWTGIATEERERN
jgi:hypothetical protein